MAIARNPEDARRLTIKRNSVAVVTDGSAVLGLGNIGPAAALPVMEGKAALFKRFAGIDAWPICLDTQDVDEIVRTVQIIAPGLRRHQPGGHLRAALLRGGAPAARAARHPGLPRRPARHRDLRARRADQRAARGRARSWRDVRITMAGAGAAGTAVLRLLLAAGRPRRVVCDYRGAVHRGRDDLDDSLRWIAEHTNAEGYTGDLRGAVAGADVFIGRVRARASSPATTSPRWPTTRSCSRSPTPTRRSDPDEAREHAAVVATGRSRLPEPDQQRAGLPRRVPRPARRAGHGRSPRRCCSPPRARSPRW